MIRQMELQHYLDEEQYESLASRLGMDTSKKIGKDNVRVFTDPANPIRRVQMYTISYRVLAEDGGDPVQIWFMPIKIDLNTLFKAQPDTLVPADDTDYERFKALLLDAYRQHLGDVLAEAFPQIIEGSLCSYVEFATHIETPDAEGLMSKISSGSFKKEQLDINCFDTFKLRNATPTLTVNRLNETRIRLCAKCPGVSLKRLLKTGNRGVGVPIPTVLEKETAVDILSKQVMKYMAKAETPEELTRTAIWNSI